ncbi:hypothetical protein [Pseudotamlana agarivorans]|uniref:hypothetical protein n=1 Tax=Pseudotamlana agarivorans TaxID=481183 RepID=UPI00082AE719|nr:hypothetical protein [Tamlana agarivorans]
MKILYLLSILAFLSIYSLHPQEKDYSFNRLNTRIQTLRGQAVSEIYSVTYTKNEASLNPQYVKLKGKLDQLLADSISINTAYNKAFSRYDTISIIKNKIIAFNSSTESFGKKVMLLKEAQILATKHHIKELLYSDNQINKEMKAGFLLLRLNLNDLTSHLNSVLSRLEDKYKLPETPEYTSTIDLRKKISNTNKFNTNTNSKLEKGFILQDKIVPPENITGDFVLVNSYYVLKMSTNGFSKNQLVSKNTIYKLGISRKKLLSKKVKLLIQNKMTNDMYLVDHKFLDHFSVKS